MSYQPVENYGIIGDLNTLALVGLNGSIDFMCFPDFDSPSVFAALLDEKKGGFFSIAPAFGQMKNKQLYLPDTNILITRFLSSEGVGEITDFMPVESLYGSNILIRRVANVRGEGSYHMNCNPAFNYARSNHKVEKQGNDLVFTSQGEDKLVLRLKSSVPLEIKDGNGFAEFKLQTNQHADFVLERVQNGNTLRPIHEFITEALFKTAKYWRDWMATSKYNGRWRESVNRSALTLKLLTSQKYGSMVASPTFGLPESVGGSRNWDYRYTWIRDTAFTIYSLTSLGYTKEAEDFMQWVEKKCQDMGKAGYMGLVYRINGRKDLEETELSHLEGYKNSKPVRIGNAAYQQFQLDIYGELMDCVYLYNKHVQPISYDFWLSLAEQINWLCDNWKRQDHGIWEVRGGERKFLYSRFMCWVALDRAIKLGSSRPFPIPKRWGKERDELYNSIFKDFWNDKLKAFVQYKGADYVDASSLLMPLRRVISPTDPRWLSTMKQIEEQLVSDSLVYRYMPGKAASDGLNEKEGTFSMCTFWYVECLSRAGHLEKARFYFEKMMGYANHLGLYSEELGFKGEFLGNFPQAFTHLGLISAALNLDKQLNEHKNRNHNNEINTEL